MPEMNEQIVDGLGLMVSITSMMAIADDTPDLTMIRETGERFSNSLMLLAKMIGGEDMATAVAAAAITNITMADMMTDDEFPFSD